VQGQHRPAIRKNMLTKILGTTTNLTLSGTAQTITVTNTIQSGNPNVIKIRIATNSQPAYVTFGTTATTSTGILIPSNYCEHFKLDSTSTVSVIQAGTAGLISITPVA